MEQSIVSVVRELVVDGTLVGYLTLRTAKKGALIDWRVAPAGCALQHRNGYIHKSVNQSNGDTPDVGEADLQLVEDSEYEYEISSMYSLHGLGPAEVWSSITFADKRGRLRPGRWLGTVRLSVTVDVGTAEVPVEVVSRKLGYRSHYRWMLSDLTDRLVDLVMHAFSPSELMAFELGSFQRDPATIYQRFKLISNALDREDVVAALELIGRSPDRRYEGRQSDMSPARARVRGHEKVPTGGQVEVPTGGQLKVPTPCSSCRPGT